MNHNLSPQATASISPETPKQRQVLEVPNIDYPESHNVIEEDYFAEVEAVVLVVFQSRPGLSLLREVGRFVGADVPAAIMGVAIAVLLVYRISVHFASFTKA